MNVMLGYRNIRRLLFENYPLIAILIGVVLISTALGPFQTLDTDLEYQTAQGVIRWGYPYINAWGNLFNEPPLAFYIEAVVFQIFGLSLATGVALVTSFGLACTVMVYLLGKELYSKSTGLFGAAFFALAPWELVLSRSFLIDTQCLLLSLIYLFIGLLAIRKSSLQLAGVSGVFFALALLTKLFAVFMLIPLLLLFLYYRPKVKTMLAQIFVFALPALLSTLLWYQVILKLDIMYFFSHNDFKDLNFSNVVATPTFMSDFVVKYGVGLLFFSAFVAALLVGFLFWKCFPQKFLISDLVCLSTVMAILGLVVYLAVSVNLKAPYTSAVKYAYQALPFLSLIAGSLATKSLSLLKHTAVVARNQKVVFSFIGVLGLVFVAITLLSLMGDARTLATAYYLIFRVQPNLDVGYSFYIADPLSSSSPLIVVEFIGFFVVLTGFFWVSRVYLISTLGVIRRFISNRHF